MGIWTITVITSMLPIMQEEEAPRGAGTRRPELSDRPRKTRGIIQLCQRHPGSGGRKGGGCGRLAG